MGEICGDGAAEDWLRVKFGYGVESLVNFGGVDRGCQHAAAKEAAAHACAGAVENVEESRFFGFAGEKGVAEFEVADGSGIEDQGVGSVVECGAFQMVEGGALGFAEIVE